MTSRRKLLAVSVGGMMVDMMDRVDHGMSHHTINWMTILMGPIVVGSISNHPSDVAMIR